MTHLSDMKTTCNTNLYSWVKGIPYELAFWNNLLRWSHTFEGLKNWSRLGKSIKLDGFDANTYLASVSNPVVLDVGCGMTFASGDHVDTAEGSKRLEVHYIDPLADFYNEIKRRHRRDLPDVEFGMMEYLSGSFRTGNADLVIIRNALDHSADPMKGIFEALEVLNIGGYLYLNHHPNEAEAEHYKGFHKHNICMSDNGEMLIWNKEKHIVVDDMIRDFAEIKTAVMPNGFVVSTIKKTHNLNRDLIEHKEGKGELAEAVLTQIALSMSPSYALQMKMKYIWYNTIHFFVQSLSYENRQRLRRIVYGKK